MPTLDDFKSYKQEKDNSCWACAGRSISNWYVSQNKSGSKKEYYNTDQAFANACHTATNKKEYLDINTQQSASQALFDLGYTNNTDSCTLPTSNEILTQIQEGKPLLAIVGFKELTLKKPNMECNNGHWVVIVGIESNGTKLNVFDPSDGEIHPVEYNRTHYDKGLYWQNTSYVDPISQ